VTSHLLPTFARVDLAFERGEGAWLVATNGERYLDLTSGVAVNALGHAHPQVAQAIAEQAAKLIHVSNLFRIPEGERLAERLCAASGFAETPVYDYGQLRAGHLLTGPAIVEVPTTTVVIPGGTTATVDALGNLTIRPATARSTS